jgi:hypothetical protein
MGKGGESSVQSKEPKEPKELLIDGVIYNVADMKHPGGPIIDFYAGKGTDATQAFTQFHIRSPKVMKYLASLPQRKADEKAISASHPLKDQEKLLEDFQAFTKQLESEGMFKCSPIHTLYRVMELLVLYGAGFWLFRSGYTTLGVILMAIGQGRCGWLMHEGGHISMTGNVSLDKFFQILIYGLGCGMSASWWRSQHNRHHSMPQRVGYDVDLQTLPLVAFTEKVVKRAGFGQKVWLRLQVRDSCCSDDRRAFGGYGCLGEIIPYIQQLTLSAILSLLFVSKVVQFVCWYEQQG